MFSLWVLLKIDKRTYVSRGKERLRKMGRKVNLFSLSFIHICKDFFYVAKRGEFLSKTKQGFILFSCENLYGTLEL